MEGDVRLECRQFYPFNANCAFLPFLEYANLSSMATLTDIGFYGASQKKSFIIGPKLKKVLRKYKENMTQTRSLMPKGE